MDHLKLILNEYAKEKDLTEQNICQRFANNFKFDDDTQEQISYINLVKKEKHITTIQSIDLIYL